MQQPVELSFELSLIDHPAGHRAVVLAEQDLLAEARRLSGIAIERRDEAVPGDKGAVSRWFMKVLTPGQGNAIVQLFRLWLERDQRRFVEVTITKPGDQEPHVIRVTGEKISLEVLTKALDVASGGAGS